MDHSQDKHRPPQIVRLVGFPRFWSASAFTSSMILLLFIWAQDLDGFFSCAICRVAKEGEGDMSQTQPFEFRSPHRIRKIESHTRSWNGITVRNIVHYPDPGKAWHDLSSRETTVAIVLGQVGGYCEPRLNLNRPTLRSRFDAGHTTFVPADMTVGELANRIALGEPTVVRHQALLILDKQGRLAGIITRGDILRALENDSEGSTTLLDAGSQRLVATYPDELLYEAAAKMLRNDVGRLPVVSRQDPAKLVGYLGRSGIMTARLRRLEEEHVREPGWIKKFRP